MRVSSSAISRVVLDQHAAHQLSQRADELDAGGAAAGDDEGQQRAAHVGIGLGRGALEGAQDAVAQPGGVVEALDDVAVPLDAVHAEEVGGGPGGQDQVIVAQRAGVGLHLAAVKVDAGDARHAEGDVRPVAHGGAHRVGNRLQLDAGGRDLIQQRLEQVVVVAVDEPHVEALVAQFPGSPQPAKPRPHDHHALHRSLLQH